MNITIWYEYIQEAGYLRRDLVKQGISDEDFARFFEHTANISREIKEVYPDGLMAPIIKALKEAFGGAFVSECNDIDIINEAKQGHCVQLAEGININYRTLYDENFGLSDELLDNTDVLIWWSHIAQDEVPDEWAEKIVKKIQSGMGFIALHSAHKSKPFMKILGSSGTLKWREGDFCRVWNTCPTHPIAAGISESIELSEEEMYGEYFDIPRPDDVVFTSWFRGGEVFRSGCTWTRGYGKIFYFQPGHETSPSYNNPLITKIICNAVKWAAPTMYRSDNFECPNIVEAPESKYSR